MKFTLFATGGTIASVSSDAGLTPGVSAEALLRLCPDLMGFEHDIDAVDIMSKDSSNMRPEDWFEIAERIRGVAAEHDAQDEPVSRAAQGGARLRATDAVVLLHGTDTMAWTAAALSYLLNDISIPVVMTGSMIPAGEPGNDASDNVFAAIQFAMQLAMYRRKGVTVAFDGDLIHGPRVLKVDSRRNHAFVSVDYPILGEMKDKGTHKIAWLNAHTPKLSSNRPWGARPEIEKNIALLPIFPGMSASLLDAITEKKPRAVLLEGYGLGGVPMDDDLLSSIKKGIDSGVIFVVRTQSLFGGTDLSVYEVGRKVMELGAISARDMTREALMTKMMLCLPLCSDRDDLARLLGENVCDDVLL